MEETTKNLSYKEIEDLIEKKGIKPTANRILVMRELLKASRPISLADLKDLFEHTLDKASIFRVLELFSKKDIVHVIDDGSRSLKYELCNGNSHHSISDQHVHFFCEHCKEIFCFPDIHVPMIELPEGFLSHSINFVIKGTCPKCSKQFTPYSSQYPIS